MSHITPHFYSVAIHIALLHLIANVEASHMAYTIGKILCVLLYCSYIVSYLHYSVIYVADGYGNLTNTSQITVYNDLAVLYT